MEGLEIPTVTKHRSQVVDLLNFLSNPLILHQTVPYLPISSLLALGGASKSFCDLIHHTPTVFRYLDLTCVNSLHFEIKRIDQGGEVWRNIQLDENVTEDDFYAGPLRGVFSGLSRRHILQDVQTLILDGLSVTSELITEIILSPTFNVRLLSIREVQNLNERKLMQALEYSVRPARAANTPRLQGVYIFGRKEARALSKASYHAEWNNFTRNAQNHQAIAGVTAIQGAQIGAQLNQRSRDELSTSVNNEADDMHDRAGVILKDTPTTGWPETMLACQGLISFDAVLCTGPRHTLLFDPGECGPERPPWYGRQAAHLSPAVAAIALHGCENCHSAPEGIAIYGVSAAEKFPLLAPPPLHSSTIQAAKRQRMSKNGKKSRLLTRCRECLKGRYCESCHKWWCEDCYEISAGQRFMKPLQTVISTIEETRWTENNLKVYMGLCVENCLVGEMMSGAGSNGMWG